MRSIVRVMLTLVLLLAGAGSAAAQSAWTEMSVSASYIDFDLSGTGQTSGLVVRATRPLSSRVSLEVRSLFARPCQQFQHCEDDGPAVLIAPEAQLQYHWTVGRVEPYVGGGLGAAAVRGSLGTRWDPTLSFSAGTGVRLTDRLALNGEFRLRGHEWKFTGTTTELAIGLGWRFPTF